MAHICRQEACDRFVNLWIDLAARGLCDNFGSVQFHRVWREYLWAGCPSGVQRFIRTHANEGPTAQASVEG